MRGRISGIVFIFAVDAHKNPAIKAMATSLVGLAVLTVICIVLAAMLPESPIHRAA
ncbi:MAG: hypothetical protein OEW05_12230 [Candidatus Aminicenantes bacterium]|nr:hypothetical protein [Candidatus Aminicenantes bacterium]